MKITKDVIEKIYAGWLGKVVGVRLGSPIEGMWYHSIKEKYGEITDYVFNYDLYAADDDTNGPLFFLRALEDGGNGAKMTAQDVGNALLNYAPYEHGFFWWGGYGISTEHTAYLNLRSGVPAGASGSVELNGATVAEQIGGQIFIDTWGLVAPGNPELAASLASKAASVTHGGNGVYGGVFTAVCVSLAFVENDIEKIIGRALTYIPKDCEYARVVRAICDYHKKAPDNWRDCYMYVRDNFGYDKYPGNCHIIPNTAVIILSLLYGNGDFSRAVCIANMCGWDTDCNAGNVGAIMGTLVGLSGIDKKWTDPINDLMICSSVVGKYNISDIPLNALYISKLASELSGDDLPQPYKTIVGERPDSCHFELPRSTHAINVRTFKAGDEISFEKKRLAEGDVAPKPRFSLKNTDKTSHSGSRSLEVKIKRPSDREKIFVYKNTYYHPSDFSDSRYDPEFSPLVYPGQTVHASVYIPNGAYIADARLFYFDERSGKIGYGEKANANDGKWSELELKIPRIEAGLIRAVGVCFEVQNPAGKRNDFSCFIDDLYTDGKASYTVDFSKEKAERWSWRHIDVSQFTRVKGIFFLKDGRAHLSGPDFAEVYTGDISWRDCDCSLRFVPTVGNEHYLCVRVQGAMRSYAVGFCGDEFVIMKNFNGYKKLAGVKCPLRLGQEYNIDVSISGNVIKASLNVKPMIEYTDESEPLLFGSVGISNKNGSHTELMGLEVR